MKTEAHETESTSQLKHAQEMARQAEKSLATMQLHVEACTRQIYFLVEQAKQMHGQALINASMQFANQAVPEKGEADEFKATEG